MTEHWFDRATKFLAGGAVPRRCLLHTAVVAGASTLVSRTAAVAAPGGEVAQRIPPILPLPRTIEPCTLRYNSAGTTTTFSAQASYQGKPLVLHGVQTTSGRRNRSVTLHLEVSYGGESLFDLVHSTVPARDPAGRRVVVSKGAISYGPAVRGVRQILYLESGGAVTGFMDGRAFSAGARTPAALRFADRRPAPTAGIDPGLAAAVRTLFDNAGRDIQNCRSVRGTSPIGPVRRAVFPSPNDGVTRRTLLAQSVSPLAAPVLVAQGTQGACDDCINTCDKKMAACLAGAGATCATTGALTLGLSCLGVAGCYDDYDNCGKDCNKSGGPCCNKGCSDGTCCAQEDTCCPGTCCGPSTPVCIPAGFCCPADQPVGCTGVAPPAGQGGMSVAFDACCRSDSTCCNGNCCAADQYCANATWGICCPKGQQWCWNGAVVSTTNVITGVTSQSNVMACCSGSCLNDGRGNLVCCPQDLLCGGACCSAGQRCMKTNSGRSVCCDHGLCGGELCCGVNDVCRNGKCTPPGVPCGNTYCGVANPVCCNGVCCASNQTCVNGRCTGAACPPGQVPCPYTPNRCCPPHFICCGGGPSGHSCCNPATQVCCGSRGCLPAGSQCVQ